MLVATGAYHTTRSEDPFLLTGMQCTAGKARVRYKLSNGTGYGNLEVEKDVQLSKRRPPWLEKRRGVKLYNHSELTGLRIFTDGSRR